MQTFQVTTGPPSGPRNFVFVDEHNRHKRLKVMRACEGCRKRKIKCDAATTNTWPCGACRRLKLPCVPPTGGLDGDQFSEQTDSLHDSSLTDQSTQGFVHQYDVFAASSQHQRSQSLGVSTAPFDPASSQVLYNSSDYPYVAPGERARFEPRPSLHDFRPQGPGQTQSFEDAASPTTTEQTTAESLTEQLGELQIDDAGVAGYIRPPSSAVREISGPIQETELYLPPLSTAAGSQIRIPPALMPSDQDAMDLFATFFEHVHPYAPVICREEFYNQWHRNREAISPLLLEAIFACATRMSGNPVGDAPWLALANKHEASFLDTPRLSTVQALLLLLKAREGSPKKGYFYRSWMTTKTILSMAKDLELHEHRANHEAGEPCESHPADCLAKTRIWQTIFVVELMIGAPQGRIDMGVDPETVEYRSNPPNHDINEYETTITRHFTYYVRNVRNIRMCLNAYARLKKNKDWALDPIFEERAHSFDQWTSELPPDLQLILPQDGTVKGLTSHFIGNMHSHHQLGIIMLNRPRLLALKSTANDELWRSRLSICYNAAKRLCKIQEAIMAKHDITGLLAMQRGMSFTVYAILTCVMLHLVAITSPDPDFNADAREYFIRHMRLLEQCIPEWPMPETEQQIYNLRAAFSADLDKPFDLRASFPYGTPSESSPMARRESDQHSAGYNSTQETEHYVQPHWQSQGSPHFSTPPVSINPDGSLPQTPYQYQDFSLGQSQNTYRQMAPTSYPSDELTLVQQWNPAPIIDQFTTAFLAPPSSSPGYGTSPPPLMSTSTTHQQFTPSPQTPNHDQNVYNQYQSHTAHQSLAGVGQHQPLTPTSSSQALQGHYFDHTLATPPANPHAIPHTLQQQAYLTDPTMQQVQQNNMPHNQSPHHLHPHNQQQQQPQPSMVFVTPKEWQQSVASVFDPSGRKRRWEF